jgi:hypothetical protein
VIVTIGLASGWIEDLSPEWIQKEGIDGEIPSLSILHQGTGKSDVVGVPPVAVTDLGAESRRLNVTVILYDEHDSEFCPDLLRIGKQLDDSFGTGVGGDIEVPRRATQQKITDRPPHEVSLVPGGGQGPDNSESLVRFRR